MSVFYLLIAAVLIFFLLSTAIVGPECPVCHSSHGWRKYYWGSNTDSKTNFCSNCKRVQYHYDIDKFTIFSEKQDFIAE